MTEQPDRNFRLACVTARAAIQVDQWDNAEDGKGPELEHLRERANTLIDILRELVRASRED